MEGRKDLKDSKSNPAGDAAENEVIQEVAVDANKEAANHYTGEDIQVLKGLEGVRHRPAMYIGTTSEPGLHHLVYEIVDNSIDEVMSGYCDRITVHMHNDGSVSVEDNGRGIPVDPMPEEGGKSALEVILTTLHAGGKFGGGAYKVSGGLHGVGASVVNALSARFEAEVYRDGKTHRAVFELGKLVEPLKETGSTKKRGTMVRFWPDPDILETVDFKAIILEERLRELAFLNAGCEIVLVNDMASDEEERRKRFKYSGGLSEFVKYLNRNSTAIGPVIHFAKEVNGSRIEIAMQWTAGYRDRINGYANNIFTKDGGTHLVGFKTALTRTVNNYASKRELVKGNESITGDDVREGLTAVVSVWLTEPQFEGQTKGQLGNSEVRGHVETALGEQLNIFLDENPGPAKKIVERAAAAARAREAAKRARDIERKKSGLSSSLPGKLTDCSDRNPANCELFIVEGDSAAGPAKQARNRNFQAILPIRGKILNVERAGMHKVLQNEQVRNIIAAVGANFGPNYDAEKLRYHKVVILTDADVDGAHIRTLLLTFFFNFMPELIEQGHLYIARNPLFRLRKGKQKPIYVFTEVERDAQLKELGGNVQVTRFKGLGEMNPEELWNCTMDPEKRTLLKVNIEDRRHAEEVFDRLMGSEVQPRKRFIIEYAREVRNLDI
ncbi:type IIA DNA topoisomerase subunit B [bacterium]|nr:type IIA DNA topoisomerase subunit B [bacterium]